MRIPCRTSAKHRAQDGSQMRQTCPSHDAGCRPKMGAVLQPATSLQLPQTIWTEIQVWLWPNERAALGFTEFQKQHSIRGSILWPRPGLQHFLQFCPSKSSKNTDKRVTMTLDELSMQVYAFVYANTSWCLPVLTASPPVALHESSVSSLSASGIWHLPVTPVQAPLPTVTSPHSGYLHNTCRAVMPQMLALLCASCVKSDH